MFAQQSWDHSAHRNANLQYTWGELYSGTALQIAHTRSFTTPKRYVTNQLWNVLLKMDSEWSLSCYKQSLQYTHVTYFSGLVGENCLRSSDCTEGLCCARHFWSKICKPVVKDGQVCTKHQRKGTHGLEIFQRCDCGDGLSCRTQRGEHNSKASRSLHTCQRHWINELSAAIHGFP